MRHHIDLRPILVNPEAAELLLLARGQLNRAFRRHGLIPPDPLVPGDAAGIDPAELDDPAAQGIDHAMAKFQDAFIAWAGAMPVKLGPPVLDILRQAHRTLSQSPDGRTVAEVALQTACDFLQQCLHPDPDASDVA
jgi:hypothetical protein